MAIMAEAIMVEEAKDASARPDPRAAAEVRAVEVAAMHRASLASDP